MNLDEFVGLPLFNSMGEHMGMIVGITADKQRFKCSDGDEWEIERLEVGRSDRITTDAAKARKWNELCMSRRWNEWQAELDKE